MTHFPIVNRNRNTDKSVVTYPVQKLPLNFQDVTLATKQATKKFQGIYTGDLGCAIVRDDNKRVITNTSSDYQLVPHTDVINAVEAVFDINKWKYQLYDINTGGRRGNKMYVTYHLSQYKFDVSEGDTMIPYIQVYNSYDKSLLFGAAVGLYRQICSNGLVITTKTNSLKMRHFKENISLSDVALEIEAFLAEVGMAKKKLLIMKTEEISDTTIEKLLPKIFKRERDQKKVKDSGILKDYFTELGKTKYAFMNACTAYATHIMPTYSDNYDHEFEIQGKISRLFFN